MSETIDARGLSCPTPVLMAKKTVDADSNLQEITVIVDNEASMENVSRFLTSKNFNVEIFSEGSDFKIVGKADSSGAVSTSKQSISKSEPSIEVTDSHKQKILVFAATDRVGFGDDELGKKLMVSFLKTIKEMGDELWRLVFVNNGVKLTVEGSAVLEDLLEYERDGLKIMVCGTCLTHFNLLDAKKVGETTNMLDIVTAMQLADKVINI
ncbi:MAG: sulfurtransferase-like selenium metabolism protein YedF [Desulfamplus sp.]|nr:sulfurtransferase-like selenium metabolism protein YedF [Desulfamplus sp.]